MQTAIKVSGDLYNSITWFSFLLSVNACILYSFNFTFNKLCFPFYRLFAQNLNPASLMPSMSESSITAKQDYCDGLQRSQSAQFLPDDSLSEEDDDMNHYENVIPKSKASSKASKAMPKIATRKSNRKTGKTDYNEYSDWKSDWSTAAVVNFCIFLKCCVTIVFIKTFV